MSEGRLMATPSKAGFTKGPVRASLSSAFVRDANGEALASVYGDDPNCKVDEVARARTVLIAEAFDTLNETGLTPRQLAEHRAELLTACKSAEKWLSGWASAEPFLTTIRAAVAKTGGARPFYGAECPSYPNCTGGCGCGCTHDVEAAKAQEGGAA